MRLGSGRAGELRSWGRKAKERVTAPLPRSPVPGSSVEVLLDLAIEQRLRHRADDRVDVLAVLEEQNARNGADAVLRCDVLIRIDVELGDLHAAGILTSELFDDGCHHATRSAPRGPEVHDGKTLTLLDFVAEVRVSDCDRPAVSVFRHPHRLIVLPCGVTPAAGPC